MNLAVVGTGYVGLVTGTCLAETGNNVICVDIDEAKIAQMRKGIIPIYEPQLDIVFERNIKANRIAFTTDLKKAVNQSDVIFLALPTPPGEDGSADLSYILGVAEQLGKMITEYKVIVDKSTVPVGTADLVYKTIAKYAKVDFDVVSNPEFLREGFAVEDFMHPDRIIIGSSSERASKIMKKVYHAFERNGGPVIIMDEKSAELTKYAANSFLATKITFMNEVANYCELVGANVDAVRIGMGADERIGKRFLYPGIGYGGSCFPKDVKALVKSGQDENYQFQILEAVEAVNNIQKTILIPRVEKELGDLRGKKIAIWGLAFKPDTDDIREASSLEMITQLLGKGAEITAYDPEAMNNVKKLYPLADKVTFTEEMYTALADADALIIATEWQVFRTPDFDKMKSLLKNSIIFDGRNIYDVELMEEREFKYFSIGR